MRSARQQLDRDVHAALLNYDDGPGFGTGTYKAGQRAGKLRIVASWSNGHHDPPPELKKLTDHLAQNEISLSEFVNEEVRGQPGALRTLYEHLRQDPKREVELRGFGKQRLADVLAAFGYVNLRKAARK